MNYFELMNDFIDGSLLADKEEELFLALSSSEELRYQMKQLVALNSVTKNKQMVSAPSGAATAALFARLGVEDPDAPGNQQPDTPKPVGFIHKYGQSIISSIVSVAASFILFMLVFGNDGDGRQAIPVNKNIASTEQPAANNQHSVHRDKSLSSADSEKSVEKSITAAKNDNNEKVRTVVKYKYIYVDRNETNKEIESDAVISDEPAENKNMNRNIANIDKINESQIISFNNIRTNPDTDFTMPDLQNNSDLELPDKMNGSISDIVLLENQQDNDMPSDFTLEIRGNTDWLMPNPTVEPQKKATFSNNSVTGLYRFAHTGLLDGDLYLGADLRQENFFQKFTGFDNNGIKNIYEQQPNFTSYDAVFRYVNRSLPLVNPFLQASLGGNKAGYIARGMAGLLITPYSNINFVIGLEYSNLIYKHEANRFESGKIGLNYGVTFNF